MIILDTNVHSELQHTSPDLGVIDWYTEQPTSDLYVTAVSEAEIRFGAEILPLGNRQERLKVGLDTLFGSLFAGRILPFDSNAAYLYAEIAASRRGAGRPISLADCQIAAIAHSYGAALATRNVKDFQDCGVELINPWSVS